MKSGRLSAKKCVKTAIVYDTSAQDERTGEVQIPRTPSQLLKRKESAQSGRVLHTDHNFYNSKEYVHISEKSARTALKKNSGTIVCSGMGARSVFGMDDR